MAGHIEEPFRISFQADSWHSGSISFGRYENEALCWERRSSFSHNRYLEEVERYSKPGLVTEKKAYFEARFKRKALLSQSSSEWQSRTESQASENDVNENTGYEEDFEHVNEIGHSARFVENDDESTHLLKDETEYQARENVVTENTGYDGDFEHVSEVGHSARFDENHDGPTPLWKNETEYQAKENDVTENIGYEGDFEQMNGVGHSACFEESLDGSNNGDVEVTECEGEESSIVHSGIQTEHPIKSPDLLASVSEHLEAEATNHHDAGNSPFVDPVPDIEVKEKLDCQISSIGFWSNSVDLSPHAQTTEKDGSISSGPPQSSSPKMRTASESKHTESRMLSRVSVTHGKGTISKPSSKDIPTKPSTRDSDVSLRYKGKKPRSEATAALHLRPTARIQSPEVSSGSKANVRNQHKRAEQEPGAIKIVASHVFTSEKVTHTVHQSANRAKQTTSSSKPGVKNGSGFSVKSEERVEKRKEFPVKLEDKMHAKDSKIHQLRARTQEKKEAEVKQLRRSLNFKATPMPSFYHEPSRRSDKNKELASKTKSSKSQSKPSPPGTTATRATLNTASCSGAAINNNHLSTSKVRYVTDSPKASEETNHSSAVLSDCSVPSVALTTNNVHQTRAKRVQDKRQVANSPRQKALEVNKGLKAEEKPKVGARRMGNIATRKDIRGNDLGRSSRTGRLVVGVAS